MERYFLGEEFTQEEISQALRTHVIEGDIVPVMMGSGINCQGFKGAFAGHGQILPVTGSF